MRWIEETSQQNTLNDATTYTQFPWHLVESPVEAKSEMELSSTLFRVRVGVSAKSIF